MLQNRGHEKTINVVEKHLLKHAMTEKRTEFQVSNFKLPTEKAGEIGQRLRAYIAVTEDLSSVPSTHGRQLIITYNSELQGI